MRCAEWSQLKCCDREYGEGQGAEVGALKPGHEEEHWQRTASSQALRQERGLTGCGSRWWGRGCQWKSEGHHTRFHLEMPVKIINGPAEFISPDLGFLIPPAAKSSSVHHALAVCCLLSAVLSGVRAQRSRPAEDLAMRPWKPQQRSYCHS